jgi:flagellar protein FlaG
MQINSVQHASRQQLQDEVLALIRSRSARPDATRKAADERAEMDRPAERAAAPVGEVQTEHAVREINEALKVLSTSLHFEIDERSGKTLVKVVDRDSGELLRQIPSEATLQIARSLDKLVGHLVNQSI